MKEIKREIIDGNISVTIQVSGKEVDIRIAPMQLDTRVVKNAVLSVESRDEDGNVVVIGGEILEPEITETFLRETTREDIDRIIENAEKQIRDNIERNGLLQALL